MAENLPKAAGSSVHAPTLLILVETLQQLQLLDISKSVLSSGNFEEAE